MSRAGRELKAARIRLLGKSRHDDELDWAFKIADIECWAQCGKVQR